MKIARPRQDAFGDDEIDHPHDGALRGFGLGQHRVVDVIIFFGLQRRDVGVGLHPLEKLVQDILGAVQLVYLLLDDGGTGE